MSEGWKVKEGAASERDDAFRLVLLNSLASLIAKGSTAGLYLLFAPFYIQLLGREAYGLISFFFLLQATLLILDLGFSGTINREFANLSSQSDSRRQQRVTLITLERVYWAGGAFLGLIIFVSAPLIAQGYLNVQVLPTDTVTQAVRWMALTLAIQFPFYLYQGGLMGLQRQLSASLIMIVANVLRYAGGFIVINYFSREVISFFKWQAMVGLIQTGLAWLLVHRVVPRVTPPARFSRDKFAELSGFALGLTGMNITIVLLQQGDKLIIGKLSTLEQLGIYSLAASVASGFTLIGGALSGAMYPRLCQLVASENAAELIRFYRIACQLIALIIIPAGLIVIYYANDLMLYWTGDVLLSQMAAPLVAVSTFATVLNAVVIMPYSLQLANGWTSLALKTNLVLLGVQLPLTAILTLRYGPTGAAVVLILQNLVYIFLLVPLMHQRLLRDELRYWVQYGVLLPLLFSSLVLGGFKVWLPAARTLSDLGLVLLVTGLTTLVNACLLPEIGQKLVPMFGRKITGLSFFLLK